MSAREPYLSTLVVVTATAAFCTACSNSEPPGGSPARLGGGTGSSGGGSTGGRPLRVLFIGNSYTYSNDLPAVVRTLGANTPGAAVEVESILVAGATLYDHWIGPVAQARIATKAFDAVVVQGRSTEPLLETVAFDQYAALFSRAIKGAGARGVWFATWARAEGEGVYQSFGALLRDPTYMAQQLDFRYALAAKHDDGTLARVGTAFRIAHDAYPDVRLHIEDGSHPSPEGSLLAACVLLPALTGREAILPEPPPLGVSRDVANSLCSIVSKISPKSASTRASQPPAVRAIP